MRRAVRDPIRQPVRALVGNCPECGRVVVVENNGESWPWLTCECGGQGDTGWLEGGTFYERVEVSA